MICRAEHTNQPILDEAAAASTEADRYAASVGHCWELPPSLRIHRFEKARRSIDTEDADRHHLPTAHAAASVKESSPVSKLEQGHSAQAFSFWKELEATSLTPCGDRHLTMSPEWHMPAATAEEQSPELS